MKKNQTAAELLAELNARPGFVARRSSQEEALQRRREELRIAEAPLIEALRAVGCSARSAWDLIPPFKRAGAAAAPHPEALPILLDHLSRPYPNAVLEGIARSLATPDARFAWPSLVGRFKEEQDTRVKDGLAVALAAMADDELIDELFSLARDAHHGQSRILLLSAMERSSDPRVLGRLESLAGDTELAREVGLILRRLSRKAGSASPKNARSRG